MPDIMQEVLQERASQDAKWGGSSHDDEHTPEDWADFIDERLYRLVTGSKEDARKALVQIAALAVAAIESMDRK